MKVSEHDFHCKGRNGAEKQIFNEYSQAPYVRIIRYNRKDGKQMIGMLFYNFHEIFANRDYVKYQVKNNRIYFKFTNEKDIHAFKLTFTGTNTVDNAKALESGKFPRKFQLDSDKALLPFCGKSYGPYFDEESKLYFIENDIKTKKLF